MTQNFCRDNCNQAEEPGFESEKSLLLSAGNKPATQKWVFSVQSFTHEKVTGLAVNNGPIP